MKPNAMIAVASALVLAATLGACGQSAKPGNEKQAEKSPAAPDAKPGLSVSQARLVLPAVAGNPGAAYFNLTNGSDTAAELAAAHVDGSGNAEIHDMSAGSMNLAEGVTVTPGETVRFAPGGKHVMVFDIQDTVKAGGSAEMTLTFADGDKVSTRLKVETVAGGGAGEQAP